MPSRRVPEDVSIPFPAISLRRQKTHIGGVAAVLAVTIKNSLVSSRVNSILGPRHVGVAIMASIRAASEEGRLLFNFEAYKTLAFSVHGLPWRKAIRPSKIFKMPMPAQGGYNVIVLGIHKRAIRSVPVAAAVIFEVSVVICRATTKPIGATDGMPLATLRDDGIYIRENCQKISNIKLI